ncbi:hypothetical protein GCM10010253_37890 [Streptomyces badius]|uniref:Uncharacterized protein n=1 Tax=Streptomyces badius TaxID=1941 RepID=A0ABQ2TBV1_STRBA|nr:hypothetical protein GCM10010253_37890 [Streptomyces badius]
MLGLQAERAVALVAAAGAVGERAVELVGGVDLEARFGGPELQGAPAAGGGEAGGTAHGAGGDGAQDPAVVIAAGLLQMEPASTGR